ncbi:hypothetical protein G7068_06760 [Leucobacter viscericola]|uniref:Aminopeptidase N n=1 Tax=Leucobacter viscericola TaxID=2714935 RepID=A0A6G7XEJ5_9MICO|nr:M1 family aminopeptidase [Leucobacter viscericola]QIK62932.1 hypothetical protein G7068_06760 [Leucobacter viscericola]
MEFHSLRRARRAGLAAATAVAIALAAPLGATAASAVDPIDGAPTIGDSLFAGIGNTGYDVTHYDVKLHYLADKSITAVTTITATAAQPLRSFSLDFEGLNVDSLKVNGVDAAFTRSSDPSIESFKLHITPATPIPAGEFTVEVAYSGTPVTHNDLDGSQEGWVQTADGATALGQPVGTMTWIPSNNTPADKATFDFAFTIPTQIGGKDAAAASNGELVAKTPSADGTETTWQWKQERQQATMATMVSIGNYLVYNAPINLSSGRTIQEWTFVDPAVTTANQATIQTRRGQIEGIINFLESKYGPYPGGSTGIVVDITTLGYALETQDRSYFERSVSLGTLVHEIAHQWFGDGVTPRDWNSIWISEGMATYASAMYTQEVTGGAKTADTYYNTWNSTASSHARWTVPPGAMTDPRQLFDWQVYTRGAMAYEALKQSLTPSVFDQLLKEWNARNNGTSQTTVEFQALAEELSGKDLDPFFQSWIYNAGKPAWSSPWTLSLTSTPASGAVAPGDTIEYQLSATNTGKVPVTGGVATIDLSGLGSAATVDASSLPAELTLNGLALTWAVPDTAVAGTATTSFTAKLSNRAHGVTLPVSAVGATLGVTCDSCSVEHTTPALPAVTEADLTDAARGGISMPSKVKQGETLTITLPTADYDGETLTGLLFSAPRVLGSAAVQNKTLTLTVPADAALGSHKVAVHSALNELIGWATTEVVPADVAPKPDKFTDVPKNHKFYEPIAWLAGKGITTGYRQQDGTLKFMPAEKVSREAMVTFLYRDSGVKNYTPKGKSPFVDVKPGDKFYTQIMWAYETKVTTGTKLAGGKLKFGPKEPITREAMAAFMYRHYSKQIPNGSISAKFTDVSANHKFAKEIRWMASNGITEGYKQRNGTLKFVPKGATSREATAAFLYRAEKLR